ncbi:hypothetical protein KY289_030102 [Solanum tuberosum]|nr:hypothetical protein KY289_030102 [Solanum tuberosum]
MHYGKDWYDSQQESKYLGDEYVHEGRLRQEFPNILIYINALGLQYVFMDQGECNLSLVHEFYANWNTRRVEINKRFIKDSWVRFSVDALNEFLGTPNCDTADLLAMIERPPYRDIRHTLCGANFVARWDRVRNTGRHLTLHYGHFNLEARIWLKIVCSNLLPCRHTIDVTREIVVLVYRLMKGLPVNVGAIWKQNMLKFRTNKRTKAHDPSQGPVLTAIDRKARDDSWMGRMFGMTELQLWIGGRQVTEDEMATLTERYPFMDSAMYMCWMGPAFQEHIDDDDVTANKEDGSAEDESDDIGPGDDDTDAGDGDGNAASIAMDFSTNVATR